MVFSSILFCFIFLPAVLAVYYIVPKKLKNLVLFISSLVFYAWGEPVYVVLMIFSTIVDYIHGRLVSKFRSEGRMKAAKMTVASSAVINLALLCFFKYADFFIGTLNGLFGLSLPLLDLPLPIGISFYTFQTMSYTIDVYRGEAKMQKNIISFGAYVALFPQLIAGPIVRYQTVADELNERNVSVSDFASGIRRFIIGLSKKVLLANSIGALWDTVQGLTPGHMSVCTAWLGIIAFTFQIYFDFSGYSDMAIGLGRMFGFHFGENFDTPYESRSITEFWRRWHISLGTWFREYVYIPLGGNRCSKAKNIRNLAIVWLLTGFWHGASWNFVLWGIYYGVFIILEKFVYGRKLSKLPAFVSHIYTMFVVIIGWVIFSFENVGDIGSYVGNMFGGCASFANDIFTYLIGTYAVSLVIMLLSCTSLPKKLWGRFDGKAAVAVKNVICIVLFVLCICYLVDASYNPFLYFRF